MPGHAQVCSTGKYMSHVELPPAGNASLMVLSASARTDRRGRQLRLQPPTAPARQNIHPINAAKKLRPRDPRAAQLHDAVPRLVRGRIRTALSPSPPPRRAGGSAPCPQARGRGKLAAPIDDSRTRSNTRGDVRSVTSLGMVMVVTRSVPHELGRGNGGEGQNSVARRRGT